MEKYLTIDQLSGIIHLSKSTIYKYTCSERIPHIKVSSKRILFREDEIENWLSEQSVSVK